MAKTWRKRERPMEVIGEEFGYTCDICGCKIVPDASRKYIVVDPPTKGGLISSVSGTAEGTLYDVIDCKKCGCQLILKKRMRYASHAEIGDNNE